MGGKVWSDEEERVFWSEIVPTSSKRHLLAKPYTDDAKGWESLRKVMQATMGRRARRKYTALMLYEHYFQNSVLERFSPNAAKYVRDYIKNELSSTGQAPSERSRSIMRFVQRGRGSGRRPKTATGASNPSDSHLHNDLERPPQPDGKGDSRFLSPPVTQLPLPCPPSMASPPPPPSPVRLPPLRELGVPAVPSFYSGSPALNEPDYNFSHQHYHQTPTVLEPLFREPAYAMPNCKPPAFRTSTPYQSQGQDQTRTHTNMSLPSLSTPIYRPTPPAADSPFVKQEYVLPDPDVKVPVPHYAEVTACARLDGIA